MKELVTTCLLAAVPCLVYKPLSGCTVVVRASSGVDASVYPAATFGRLLLQVYLRSLWIVTYERS